MWIKKDLEEKLKYLNEFSKNTKDKNRKYEIFCDKCLIIEMLGLLEGKNIRINTALASLTRKLSLKKEQRKYRNYESLNFDDLKGDLKFAFHLCKNIALLPFFEYESIDKTYSNKECIDEVIRFAMNLSNKRISDDIIKTVTDYKHIYFTEPSNSSFHAADNYVLSNFKESYIATPPMPDLLLHECIHTIDKDRNGTFKENYPYSYEVPSYIMQIYKNIKAGNFSFFNAIIVLSKTTVSLACKGQREYVFDFMIEKLTFDDITNKSDYIIENLLTIKSILTAIIFVDKILNNETKGLIEYEQLLNTRFSKDMIPDYSKWGITNDIIIDYSKNLPNYFDKQQKERGGKNI